MSSRRSTPPPGPRARGLDTTERLTALLCVHVPAILVRSTLHASRARLGLAAQGALSPDELDGLVADLMVGLRLFCPPGKLPELMLSLAAFCEDERDAAEKP